MATIHRTTVSATSIGAPARQLRPSRLLGVGVVLVAIATAAAILVGTTFPKSAPQTLPAMSNSMGYWDHVQVATTTLPAVSHPFGFHDRISEKASQSLPAMSSSPGYLDYIQASTNPVIARQSSSVQSLETFRYGSAPSASAQTPATRQALETYRYTSQPRIQPPLHPVTELH